MVLAALYRDSLFFSFDYLVHCETSVCEMASAVLQ